MENPIILPIVKSPVTAFSHQAALLSILLAYDECKAWVYNNYIQIFSLNNLDGYRSGTVDFFYMDYSDFRSYEFTANPWLRFFEYPLNSFWSSRMDLEQYIYRHLKQGFYLQLEIDEYYISKYDLYQKQHYVHWIYIYGIDIANHELFCLDNFINLKFTAEIVSLKELEDGFLHQYSTIQQCENGIGPTLVLFKVMNTCEQEESNVIYELNLNRIKILLENYIGRSSQCNAYWATKYYTYGCNVYNALINYIIKISSRKELIDLRGFCVLADHKKLMLWRLQYIKKKKSLNLKDDISSYESIEKTMKVIILALLKYNLTKNTTILDSVIGKLKTVLLVEKKTILHVIEALDTK